MSPKEINEVFKLMNLSTKKTREKFENMFQTITKKEEKSICIRPNTNSDYSSEENGKLE